MKAIGNIKTCITCRQMLPLSEFNRDSRTSDGLDCRCRKCSKERNRKYRAANRDKCNAASARYHREHAEQDKERQKVYREKNRDELNRKKKIYRQTHADVIKAYNEAHKEEAKRWRQENKEKLTEYAKNWRSENKDQVKAYYKEKRTQDEQYRLSTNYRRRISLILRSGQISNRMQDLLGCDFETLKAHIEKQFKPGMAWENYGLEGWQIDHIRPCAAFDMTDPQQVKACFNYKNMQPLWRWENQEKSDKLQDGTKGRTAWQSK